MANSLVRSTIIYDYEKNRRVQKFIRSFPDKFPAAMKKRLEADVIPPLVAQLQVEPREAVHPWQFQTAKSRAWYFANKVPKGSKGGRYVRTHAFVRGWRGRVSVGDNAVTMSISNPAPQTKFITGKRQVIGHAITGWQKHENVYARAIKPAKKAAIAACRDIIAGREKS